MPAGIEAIGLYGGRTFLDVRRLFEARQLDMRRFDNLMIRRKSVPLPCEDPITYGVNAAKPIIDRLSAGEKDRIEMLITATESGIDFGKSMSTYIHHHLGLSKSCRIFEVKHACFGGTAALQTSLNFIAAGVSPGAKALVVATDLAKAAIKDSYVEPSQGSGAVALLVSDKADIMEMDLGANGNHAYEVMDSCRPTAEIETGDSDLSLIAYLDCLEHSFRHYASKVEGADFAETFRYLAFHTPFPGMVKGAHRMMMRKFCKLGGPAVDADFEKRVTPSLEYCVEIGNIYSATVYLALAGLIAKGDFRNAQRVGLYSYGSGCCAEFFSGVVPPSASAKLNALHPQEELNSRYELTMAEYDSLLDQNLEWSFGIRDKVVDLGACQDIYEQSMAGRGLLRLREIKNFHREYEWS